MIEKHKYQAYALATQTVAPTRQIVILYDGIIRFIHQAKEAIAEKRIEDRYNLLIKASEVVGGLQGALDFDNGGDMAKILYNYYSNVDAKIFSIHRTNSVETCDEVIADLKQLRDAWDEIDQNLVSKQAQAFPQEGEGAAVAAAPAAGQELPPPPIDLQGGLTISA
jgi:flagellar secretion chaperone FliS